MSRHQHLSLTQPCWQRMYYLASALIGNNFEGIGRQSDAVLTMMHPVYHSNATAKAVKSLHTRPRHSGTHLAVF